MRNKISIFTLLTLFLCSAPAFGAQPSMTYNTSTMNTSPSLANLRGASATIDDGTTVGQVDLGGSTTGTRITGALGTLSFLGLNIGDENWRFTFTGTANTITVDSTTGANIVNFSGFTLQQSGVAVASSATTMTMTGTAGEITLSTGAQSLAANRTWTFSLPTALTFTGKTITGGTYAFPDNIRQTFNPGATVAGINVGSLAGDPSSLSNGDIWYDSVANELTARINGASIALGAGGGSLTVREVDGTPSIAATVLEVTNGTLSDQGGGVARVVTGGGGGGGDVTGPASAVDNAVAVFDGTGGKIIKESPTIMSSTYNLFVKAMLMNAEVVFGGILSPAQITANEDNYTPSGITNNSVLRLETDASRSITGIKSMQDGAVLILHNVGLFNFVLVDEDVGSTDLNRFALTGNVTVTPDQSVLIQYDATTQRWRMIGGTATGTSTPITIGFTTDGGGSAIAAGVKGYYAVKNAFTITGYSMMGDQSGSAVVDIWVETDPYDGSGVVDNPPVLADSITASAKPTLSSQRGRTSTTLSGWTTTVPAGSMIGWNIDASPATITRFTFELHGNLN